MNRVAEKMNISIDNYNNLYLICEQKLERLFRETCSINRFVVSKAILYALNLIESCYGPISGLLSVNAHGIFIINSKRIFKRKEDVKFSTKMSGRVFEEDKLISYFEKNDRENLNIDDFQLNIGEGRIINSPAGSGKTHKLIEQFIKEDNPLIPSFTNKAIQNVKEGTIIRLRPSEEDNVLPSKIDQICKTFDSYFCEWNDK